MAKYTYYYYGPDEYTDTYLGHWGYTITFIERGDEKRILWEMVIPRGELGESVKE